MNELKLTPVELFSLFYFYFKYDAANAFELFSIVHLANNELFL